MLGVEVCSGVLGMSLGFERAGVEVRAHAEIDPWAREVIRKRRPDTPLVGDWTTPEAMRELKELCPNPTVLFGGVPCQPSSVAGRRGGWFDPRNLVPPFFRLARALRPTVFVIENVPGFQSVNDGLLFWRVLRYADALGYSVEWDILSAAAVGAPHKRDRIFICGRSDGLETWPQREQPSMFPGRPQSWPKAGRWTDGTLHERERQWPTPSRPGWTTPRAGDSKQGKSSTAKHLAAGMDLMLSDEVRLPGICDEELAADWTETLMSLPVGWTDPECDEPDPRPYPLPMAVGPDGPLYGASPQAPWEPPRLVEPVKGDGRRHRLRCIGNAVLPDVAEVIARSIARSLDPTESETNEHAASAARGE